MPAANPPAQLYNKALVGWLSVAQLIGWGSVFYLFAQVMAPVEQALQVGRAQTSLAFSLCLLMDGLLAYPVGRLIDQGHERLVMTLGSLTLAAGLALHSQVNNLWAFYAVWMLLGTGMAATLYAPVFAVVTRRFPHDFRRAIITMTFLGGLASTVFIPLTAWLITLLGWRHSLLVLAVLNLLVCAPLHWKWLKNAPLTVAGSWHDSINKADFEDENATGNAGAAALGTAAVGTAALGNSQTQTLAQASATPPQSAPSVSSAPPAPPASPGDNNLPLAHHLQSRVYWLIGLGLAGLSLATSALPSHMLALLREYGLSETWVVLIPASIGALQVVGRLVLYFFEQYFDVHAANRIIPCLLPLGLGFLLVAPWVAAPHSQLMLGCCLLFVLLWGMGNGMLTIVKGTAMAQYVSRVHVASLNGALGFPMALLRASAPLVLGLLWNLQTGYRNGLLFMMAMALLGAGALALAQRLALRGGVDGGGQGGAG